jgi:hypothetical protein
MSSIVGNAIFRGTSTNYGFINGHAGFAQMGKNKGHATTATFNDNSKNEASGSVGDATFNDNSSTRGMVTGTATLNDNASVEGGYINNFSNISLNNVNNFNLSPDVVYGEIDMQGYIDNCLDSITLNTPILRPCDPHEGKWVVYENFTQVLLQQPYVLNGKTEWGWYNNGAPVYVGQPALVPTTASNRYTSKLNEIMNRDDPSYAQIRVTVQAEQKAQYQTIWEKGIKKVADAASPYLGIASTAQGVIDCPNLATAVRQAAETFVAVRKGKKGPSPSDYSDEELRNMDFTNLEILDLRRGEGKGGGQVTVAKDFGKRIYSYNFNKHGGKLEIFMDKNELMKRNIRGAVQLTIPFGSIQKSRIDLNNLKYIWPDGSSNDAQVACGVFSNGIYDQGMIDQIAEIVEPTAAYDTLVSSINRARTGDGLS